ncbi:unnamed protein product [Closterium sp. NIES-53]
MPSDRVLVFFLPGAACRQVVNGSSGLTTHFRWDIPLELGGAEPEGAESGGAEPRGTASTGGPAGASPRLSHRREPLSPHQLREWFAQHTRLRSGPVGAGGPAAGGTGAGGAGATSPGGAGVPSGARGTGGAGAAGPGGARSRGIRAAGSGGVGGSGAGDPGAGGTGAGDPGAGGTGAGGAGVRGVGAGGPAVGGTGAGSAGATRPRGAGVTAGAGGPGGAGDAGPGGARTRGTGASGAGGVGDPGVGGTGAGDRGAGGTCAGGAGAGGAGAGGAEAGGPGAGSTGAGGAGAGGTGAGDPGAGGAGAGDPGAGGAGAGGAGDGSTGAGGTMQRRPLFVPPPQTSMPPPDSVLHQVLSLPSSTGLTPSLLCPPPHQTQPQLQPDSPLPAPSSYAEQRDSLKERCKPGSHPASSLADGSDPESDLARAASPTVSHLLATIVTDPSFESTAASALFAELVEIVVACRLHYAASLVAECESDCPPSIGGECTHEASTGWITKSPHISSRSKWPQGLFTCRVI